jgi:hypothetical protein
MAKRTRGSARPGQRQAGRQQPRPVSRPASVLSEAEEARAAELEARIVAQEREAEVTRSRSRDRGRTTASIEVDRAGRARTAGLLAAKAAEEYAYVVRDVRRIVRVGGAMAIILAVLYLLVDVLHVFTVG